MLRNLKFGVRGERQGVVSDEQFAAFWGMALFVIVHAVLQLPGVQVGKREVLANLWAVIVGDEPEMVAVLHLVGKMMVIEDGVQDAVFAVQPRGSGLVVGRF